MRPEGWIVLVASLTLGTAMLGLAIGLARAERRIQRIQLPARLISKVLLPPGYLLTVEFPGPDETPRRATLISAIRTGIGATPEFQGWVWVNRADPTDVVVRPRARLFWPVFLSVAGSIVLVAGLTATVVLWAIGAMDSLPTQ